MKRAIGACYYPEHWPRQTWAADARQMADAGVSHVRIGEFAWKRMEPEYGRLTLDWLDEAMDVLGAAGLQVVLGTPTATPPRWMLDRHPDMLAVDRDGRPRKFGSRRHYCFSHRGYRDECARITTILADRYGAHPALVAWQTDNEYGCHDTTRSYSDAAAAAFRLWLADRYGAVETLNEAWGNVFWSMDYDRFDQIDPPNMTVTEPNPAHVLDFHRFASDEVVSFNRLQTDIIRARSSAPILHNYMGRETDFDHFAAGGDLEIASWDSYPLGFLEDRIGASDEWKRRFMRQGDPDFQAFHHDLYRAVGRGRWWVMEQQPGPVNWAPHNPAPAPGMARLWAWEAFAHGAEVVAYFRWRQAPRAQEQMHAGLLRSDGARAAGLAEAIETAKDLSAAPDVETTAAPVAIIFDYESQWAWAAQPQGRDFDYFGLVFDIYRALRRLGLSIDVLPPDTADLSPYRFVAAPGLAMIGETLASALAAFDGVALVGPRANAKTGTMASPASAPPNLAGLDCRVAYVESLRADAPIPLAGGGAFVTWREALEGDAEVVIRTESGEPAAMRAGGVVYLAGWPDPAAARLLLEPLLHEAGVETCDMPDALRIRDAGETRFIFNYDLEPATVSGVTVPPASFVTQTRAQVREAK